MSRSKKEKAYRHQKRRMRRELKATRRRNRQKEVHFRRRRADYEKQKPPLPIAVPNIFSIVNNTKETLEFFDYLRRIAQKGRRVVLDMQNIQLLTPETILYILALSHYLRLNYEYSGISGNMPQEPTALKLFKESGFLRFMKKSPIGDITRNSDLLQIEFGKRVDPATANRVVEFALDHLKMSRSKLSKQHYSTIIECMANTSNHAYAQDESMSPFWYLMALFDKEKKRVRFIFLDGGAGIPNTIKINFKEKVKKMFAAGVSDEELIASALKGEFRTRTELKYRGKGLPKIYENATKGMIEKLKIYSGFGRVFCEQAADTEKMEKEFIGSLFVWDFLKPQEA